MNRENVYVEKPDDWPQNQREANLSNILKATEDFYKSPSYKTKEIMASLINQTDLNELNELGLFRITNYEVAILNHLYFLATAINFDSLKVYLYGHIARFTRMHKSIYNMRIHIGQEVNFYIDEYLYLMPPLKLFYHCYATFNYEKTRSLADTIISVVKDAVKTDDEEVINDIAFGYINMFKDLSNFSSAKVFRVLTFDRNELKKLFELEARLIIRTNQNIVDRPLRGVIKLTLRNWVLKSRNNYNSTELYKCISNKAGCNALTNHEVWMQRIEYLNDKRENKVIKEIFKNKQWLINDWAKNIKFSQLQNSYVCSYSKTAPSSKMKQKYGSNIFGYKSDRIGDVLAPIVLINDHPFIDQVACYDIIYSQEEAKEEINYLCDLINCFGISEKEKLKFLNDLLEYWYLSIKDKKRSYEQERRYQLFLFDYKNCIDVSIDNRFLKIKSSVYLYPDFIFSEHLLKQEVKMRRVEKLRSTAMSNYIFCHNCLQADFDSGKLASCKQVCSVCGSTDTEFVELHQ